MASHAGNLSLLRQGDDVSRSAPQLRVQPQQLALPLPQSRQQQEAAPPTALVAPVQQQQQQHQTLMMNPAYQGVHAAVQQQQPYVQVPLVGQALQLVQPQPQTLTCSSYPYLPLANGWQQPQPPLLLQPVQVSQAAQCLQCPPQHYVASAVVGSNAGPTCPLLQPAASALTPLERLDALGLQIELQRQIAEKAASFQGRPGVQDVIAAAMQKLVAVFDGNFKATGLQCWKDLSARFANLE